MHDKYLSCLKYGFIMKDLHCPERDSAVEEPNLSTQCTVIRERGGEKLVMERQKGGGECESLKGKTQ